MENRKWLPADTRQRMADLMKSRGISQAQLAEIIGVDRSVLSRFVSGKTDALSHEYVIRIAKYFDVSADFVLGTTDDPSRINYDVGELGLTVQAAECLYKRKVDPAILCRLLEHKRCGDLVNEIGLYLDETLTAGIASQNQLYSSLSQMLLSHAQEAPADRQAVKSTVQTIHAMKTPAQNERNRILADFDQILTDIKKDGPVKARQAAMLTKNTMDHMTATMTKGTSRANLRSISPEAIVNAILSQIDMSDAPESLKPETERVVASLREDLTALMSILKATKELPG